MDTLTAPPFTSDQVSILEDGSIDVQLHPVQILAFVPPEIFQTAEAKARAECLAHALVARDAPSDEDRADRFMKASRGALQAPLDNAGIQYPPKATRKQLATLLVQHGLEPAR